MLLLPTHVSYVRPMSSSSKIGSSGWDSSKICSRTRPIYGNVLQYISW
jgi:hypothetical protein